MAIYEIKSDRIEKMKETSFDKEGLLERWDLQRLLRNQIDVVTSKDEQEDDILIIAEEFGEWEDSRRRIDLLGLDKKANLVVIELKRHEDGGPMELQALRYAAMVSIMTFDKVVELYSRFLAQDGRESDARSSILKHLGWDEPEEENFAQDVRILLVAPDFSKELTTSVMWLNERNLDIRCIRIKPYSDGGRVLMDVQQIIPLPEAAEYAVQIREKEQKVRQDRSAERFVMRRKFWEGLLRKAESQTDLHENISAGHWHWIGTGAGIFGVALNYLIRTHDAAIQCYIDRGTGQADVNKRIFDALFQEKEDVERIFGSKLVWKRLNEKQASYIEHTLALGGWKDEPAKWPVIQDAMINAMIRFERALSPHISKLKTTTLGMRK